MCCVFGAALGRGVAVRRWRVGALSRSQLRRSPAGTAVAVARRTRRRHEPHARRRLHCGPRSDALGAGCTGAARVGGRGPRALAPPPASRVGAAWQPPRRKAATSRGCCGVAVLRQRNRAPLSRPLFLALSLRRAPLLARTSRLDSRVGAGEPDTSRNPLSSTWRCVGQRELHASSFNTTPLAMQARRARASAQPGVGAPSVRTAAVTTCDYIRTCRHTQFNSAAEMPWPGRPSSRVGRYGCNCKGWRLHVYTNVFDKFGLGCRLAFNQAKISAVFCLGYPTLYLMRDGPEAVSDCEEGHFSDGVLLDRSKEPACHTLHRSTCLLNARIGGKGCHELLCKDGELSALLTPEMHTRRCIIAMRCSQWW
eukprot:355578-Chlamydomonas_euryale.AAC.2